MEAIEDVWAEVSITDLKCLECNEVIGLDSTLARTFTLKGQKDGVQNHPSTTELVVDSISETLLIFHRHLKCLGKSSKYITVSHVWHPDVGHVQNEKEKATVSINAVAKIIHEEPIRVFHGVAVGLGHTDFELWHDYLSVPQWDDYWKGKIIRAIPEIYQNSAFTVIHLADTPIENIHVMRNEECTQFDRCKAISNLCNANYFSRVWTAMEFAKSGNIRVMVKGHVLVQNDKEYRSLVHEMDLRWDQQVSLVGSPHPLEIMVNMGYNLVPWQLGSLELVRFRVGLNLRNGFGNAYEYLSLRGITKQRDFFHAILGMVDIKLKYTELSSDNGDALLQIARACLKEGDLSGLFLIPGSSQVDTDDNAIQSFGYRDMRTFALGAEVEPPTYPKVDLSNPNSPILKAENIGKVKYVRKEDWGYQGPSASFSIVLQLVLECTGLDVDAIVNTLARLYGQDPKQVMKRINEQEFMKRLIQNLSKIYDQYPEEDEDLEAWVADTLCLTNKSIPSPIPDGTTPMNTLIAHGGTIHYGNAGGIVCIRCQQCSKEFLLRAGLLKPASQILDAMAYRVPGLKFDWTIAGGTGFLVKNKKIVARILWAFPTCECNKLEDVEVELPDIAMPRSNKFPYGTMTVKPGEWLPFDMQAIIKW